LENLTEIWGKVFAGFSGFSGVDIIFGMALMARRTDRRDHGVRGIPGVVADRGAGAARVCDGPGVPAGFAAHGPRVRENDRGFEKWG
jgi:hypothetical protein